VPKRIVIVQGHPDPHDDRYCHALEGAYAQGAWVGGHEVERIHVGEMEFPLLRRKDDWEKAPIEAIRKAQETIGWANHIVIIFPLWLGAMPALLKGFLEQTLRPGFAISRAVSGTTWKKELKGRSAHVVATMRMPAPVYRWYYRAHSVKSLERNILGFVGIAPVRETLIGGVEASAANRKKGLAALHDLGVAGR
jgi:putative NADPH-quinone reductase